MSRRGSMLAVGAAATAGFALLAWVSSAGPVRMLQTPTATASSPRLPRLTPPQREMPQPSGAARQTQTQSGSQGPDLTWIVGLLKVLALSLALIGVVLLARWAWGKRWHRPPRLTETHFEVLPEVSMAVVKDAAAQFAALQEGSPRNAIVACWLRLEEAAAEAGVKRDPAETSAEFTTRVLGSLAVDAAMINNFAGLYREARFSRHEVGEPARRAAVAALRSLHDDIAASSIPISSDMSAEEVR